MSFTACMFLKCLSLHVYVQQSLVFLGPKEIDGLLVPPGKAYTLLTDNLITGKPLWFEPAQEKWFKSNHLYI